MSMQARFFRIGLMFSVLIVSLLPWQRDATAQVNFQDNQIVFNGRRGVEYTAVWDDNNYTITFNTPDSTFPWDWIGFTGQHGSVALSGYPNLENTLENVHPTAIADSNPGDLWRIKGSGILSLAHLTRLGLVIGSGPNAQRSWFSDGVITKYYLAPHYIGYQVQILGRMATVKLTSLNPHDYHAVIAIEVTLDNPTDAHLLLASDLEPVMDYSVSVAPRNRESSQINFDAADQVISAVGGSVTAYAYTNQPLETWSANDLPLNDYLATDTLDGQVAAGPNDARIALRITAQPVQYFYIGTMVLDNATRNNPGPMWMALRDERIKFLSAMPRIESAALPKFEFVNALANLTLSYLLNPGGGLHYADKALLYVPDSLIPLIVTPHLLPPRAQAAYRDALTSLEQQQHAAPVNGNYSYKIDSSSWISLPPWYAGNLPDIAHYDVNGGRVNRENFSDVYATAEFISGLYQYYQITGDLAFVQGRETTIDNAITGLKTFDSAYDNDFGEDRNLYPNVLVPMSDLGLVAGEYPGETAQAIYAYEDASELLRLYNRSAEADALITDYVTPMRANYDSYFWDANSSFYMGIADQRSQTRTPGTQYNDFWFNSALVPLYGDMGRNHLSEVLTTLRGPNFYEPTHDIHWLARGSENFLTPGRWGFSPQYTNGGAMEGGYLLFPNAAIPIGYYVLNQNSLAETYANHFFDKLTQYGPYEVISEYAGQMPGRVGETSLYIEPAAATTWLLQTALNIEVNGTQVAIAPKLSGQFTAKNIHITSLGLTAILDYERDALGNEFITIIRNDGLIINAPNAQQRYAIRWGSYDDSGSSSFGFYDQDNTTPLASGDLAQLVWAGPDGIVDPPRCDGIPGNDDILLDTNTINNGDPLPMAAQNRGYLPLKVYPYAPSAPQSNGTIYVRVWNAPSTALATAYVDTSTGILSPQSIFNVPRHYTDQAQTYNAWIGPANGDWNTPGNWSMNTLPDSTTQVIVPAGSSVHLSAGASAAQLCIAEGAAIDLSAYELTVETALMNYGELQQTQTVDSNCTPATPCRFLHIQNAAGTQSLHHGVDIAQTGSGDMGATTVIVRGGQSCGNGSGFTSTVQRCFEINPASPQEATITFYYTADEANGNSAPQVWHYNGNGWDLQTLESRGGSGNALFVRASGINAYSPFALGTNAPTAVTLINFEVHPPTGSSLFALIVATLCGALAVALWRRRKSRRERS